MSVSSFIDLNESDQAAELRSYLKAKGGNISQEASTEGLAADLKQIIEACRVLWAADVSEADLEGVLNSVISLLLIVAYEPNEELMVLFCESVAKTEENPKWNDVRLRILLNLFNALDERLPLRYIVYTSLVKFAGHANLIDQVPINIDQIKQWAVQWDVGISKLQHLLRILHEAFIECNQREQATRFMIELLATYTDDTASQASSDARKCIVTSLADPGQFLLDHLLALKPVKLLEGQPIYELLTIFVSGRLSDYIQFYDKNKEFVESLGLNHTQNLEKMRILTFMQMAEGHTDIEFETIQQEMQLGADEVEQFVINAIHTKAAYAKIDHLARKVMVRSNQLRTFGKSQWQELRDELSRWQTNLGQVRASFKSVTEAQIQPA